MKHVKRFGLLISLVCFLSICFLGWLWTEGKLHFGKPEQIAVPSIYQAPTEKVILFLNPRVDPGLAVLWAKSVDRWTEENEVDRMLYLCVVMRESAFDPLLVSKAGCVGGGQINPKAHAKVIEKLGLKYAQLFHIETNTMLCTKVLRDCLDANNNNLEKALRAYVGGAHATYFKDVMTYYGRASCYFSRHKEEMDLVAMN